MGTIKKLIVSKGRKVLMDRRITRDLVSKIGSEGTIGMKNLKIYQDRIGGMVKKGEIQKAYDYSKSEARRARR